MEAIRLLAGNGTGDSRWKIPGVLDWSNGTYNPNVDITKDTTTLYASDRDVFVFLVDDLNPIEAGRLKNGDPDLYFRGFYAWNSEVGAKTLGIASFYLRAVCQNRNLWGVEDFEELTIRHSKYAASRFAHEAAPALTRFANSSALPFVNGIKAAREKIVARTDDGVAQVGVADVQKTGVVRLIPWGRIEGTLKIGGTHHLADPCSHSIRRIVLAIRPREDQV